MFENVYIKFVNQMGRVGTKPTVVEASGLEQSRFHGLKIDFQPAARLILRSPLLDSTEDQTSWTCSEHYRTSISAWFEPLESLLSLFSTMWSGSKMIRTPKYMKILPSVSQKIYK